MRCRHVRKPSRSENFRSQHPLPRSLPQNNFVKWILYKIILLRGHAQSCSKLQWLQMNPTFIELRGIQIVLHTVQRASYIYYIYISVRLYCMICNQVSVFHEIVWEHESMEIFPPPNCSVTLGLSDSNV